MALKVDSKTTYEGLIKSTALSEQTVTRAIKNLKEKGYIKREGSDKTGKWIILKDLPSKYYRSLNGRDRSGSYNLFLYLL